MSNDATPGTIEARYAWLVGELQKMFPQDQYLSDPIEPKYIEAIKALRKEAAEAIEAAYREGSNDGVFNENDNTSKPGRFFCDSRARREAQRIGGAE